MEMIRIGGETRAKVETLINFCQLLFSFDKASYFDSRFVGVLESLSELAKYYRAKTLIKVEMMRIGGETRTKVETLINFIVKSYSRLTSASD